MKEKTFEELIRERIDKGDAFTPTGIIEMMQQVREATIEECQQKVTYTIGGYLGADKLLNNLPTDRIKTEK